MASAACRRLTSNSARSWGGEFVGRRTRADYRHVKLLRILIGRPENHRLSAHWWHRLAVVAYVIFMLWAGLVVADAFSRDYAVESGRYTVLHRYQDPQGAGARLRFRTDGRVYRALYGAAADDARRQLEAFEPLGCVTSRHTLRRDLRTAEQCLAPNEWVHYTLTSRFWLLQVWLPALVVLACCGVALGNLYFRGFLYVVHGRARSGTPVAVRATSHRVGGFVFWDRR
jgi:hypothetical protein